MVCVCVCVCVRVPEYQWVIGPAACQTNSPQQHHSAPQAMRRFRFFFLGWPSSGFGMPPLETSTAVTATVVTPSDPGTWAATAFIGAGIATACVTVDGSMAPRSNLSAHL